MQQAEVDIASVLSVLESRRDDLHIAQELIEALPIPVFFKGRDGRYLGVNRAWEDFFGVARSEMLGRAVRDLYPNAPDIAQRHVAMDEQLWKRPGPQSYEIRLPLPNGRVRIEVAHDAPEDLGARDAEEVLPRAVHAQIAAVARLEENRRRQGLDELLRDVQVVAARLERRQDRGDVSLLHPPVSSRWWTCCAVLLPVFL